jgi:hypothetical protein
MKVIAVSLAALALVGCATTPNVHLSEAKGLAASWAALDAIAVTLDGLATTHVLHGPQAATAAADLAKAQAVLTAATAAYNSGDNATAAQNVAAATVLITELVSIAQTNGK